MTSTTEMPEKIWAEENGTWEHEHNVLRDYIPYVREDTIPDVAELQRQNAVLKEFITRDMDTEVRCGTGCEEALELGITEYFADPNNRTDVRLVYADWMISDDAKMPIPSKAEVAREFMDAVEKRTRLGLLTVQDLGDVLKEWEDAESK